MDDLYNQRFVYNALTTGELRLVQGPVKTKVLRVVM
jgi:hypothetical protein